MVGKVPLFESDQEVEDEELHVNEQYAKRLEYNKRREELHKLQAKHPEMAAAIDEKLAALRDGKQTDLGDIYAAAGTARPKRVPQPAVQAKVYGVKDGFAAKKLAGAAGTMEAKGVERDDDDGDSEDDQESDSEEEDHGEQVDAAATEQVLQTILKIKRKDPSVYNPTTTFFKDLGQQETAEKRGKGGKPLLLKDVLARQALDRADNDEGDDDADEDAAEYDVAAAPSRHGLAYDAAQEEARQAFLTAALDDAGEGEDGDEQEGLEPTVVRPKGDGAQGGAAIGGLLDQVFGPAGVSDPDSAFLRDYIQNARWMDGEDDGEVGVQRYIDGVVAGGDDVADDGADDVADAGGRGGAAGELGLDEDEEFVEQAEVYEQKYNFRYEEPGGTDLVAHPRHQADTLRRQDKKRKRQREAKAKRDEAAREERAEELRRLKNLKKQEIEDKLSAIQKVAGSHAPGMEQVRDMLEGDFDPDKFDAAMAAAFGGGYYDDAEDDEDAILEDDVAEREAQKVPDAPGSFSQKHKSLLHQTQQLDEEFGYTEQEQAAGKAVEPGVSKEERAKQRAAYQQLLQEYYNLDYEDSIGDLKCRFKYRSVEPEMFGLSFDDILRADDKELNSIVGLKKLAPYRDAPVRPNYKALKELTGRRGAAPPGGNARKHGAARGGSSGWVQGGKGPGSQARAQRVGDRGKGEEAGEGAKVRTTKVAEKPTFTAAGMGSKEKQELRKKHFKEKAAAGKGYSRLDSYALPKLHRPKEGTEGGQKRKRAESEQPTHIPGGAEQGPRSGLTKAQKKNLKRSQKRKTKEQGQ